MALQLLVFLLNLEDHVLGKLMDVRIATRYYLIPFNFVLSFFQYIKHLRSVLEEAAVAQAVGPVVEAVAQAVALEVIVS